MMRMSPALFAELAALGLQRALPPWRRGEAPAYPRQAMPTTQSKPVWLGEVAKEHKTAAAELKEAGHRCVVCGAKAQRRAAVGTQDPLQGHRRGPHRCAVGARAGTVRLPVFVAAPKTVGITSTGETGDGVVSELPALLRAYRDFEKWIEHGGAAEATPNFQVPSAA